ncbi:bestrophin-2-like isoform X2 [Paramacrobiotus metropolitanus]|uniref:bestrophin-2-like isoform X2 n=1 Tax=Paramacrobiotus metropolitanus TaxID=2943436 RepID=UPI002445AA14|nr:bestrophin-2-like isoform X2 [Paramacrobiotus metropolitanus]XP_055349587.1 bestrophin-2-like isoform X2 [Paramacrobiotus metropolitanus]XP_055349588.1 bestrophin-2-like isoform X2 [Paramacrobiotus metropolitanus]
MCSSWLADGGISISIIHGLTVILHINGLDERSRIIRRTMARWTCLSTILLTRGVSIVAKKRFPTLEHLCEVGLMTQEEVDLYEQVNIPYAKFWVPMLWFTELLKVAKKEGLMDDKSGVSTKHVMEEIANFRTNQWRIWSFDWVSVPLVYTQVVTLATYGYFFCCLFSRQFLDPSQGYEHFYVDFYFPVFTFLQFFFYVGWLKVAESLINPWGEDDDDFEVNWFIDRHVQVAFLTVDEKFAQMPTIGKDRYWNTTEVKVPYTNKRDLTRRLSVNNIGSTMNLHIPNGAAQLLQIPNTLTLPKPGRIGGLLNGRNMPGLTRRRSSCTPKFEHLSRHPTNLQPNGDVDFDNNPETGTLRTPVDVDTISERWETSSLLSRHRTDTLNSQLRYPQHSGLDGHPTHTRISVHSMHSEPVVAPGAQTPVITISKAPMADDQSASYGSGLDINQSLEQVSPRKNPPRRKITLASLL